MAVMQASLRGIRNSRDERLWKWLLLEFLPKRFLVPVSMGKFYQVYRDQCAGVQLHQEDCLDALIPAQKELFFFPLSLNSFANSLHNIGAAWAVPESPRAEHVLMFESPPCPAQTPLCSHHSPGSVGGGDAELGRELSVPRFYSEAPQALAWVLPGIISCTSSFPDVSSFADFSCDSSFSLCSPDAKCEYPFPP